MNAQAEASQPLESLKIMLAGIIDYAGLFPPSQLSMEKAVANYAEYRKSPHSWMLGRFIVPVARLQEFRECAEEFIQADPSNVWYISALSGEDITETVKIIRQFNTDNAPNVIVDALEVKANTISKIENTVSLIDDDLETYFEISMGENFVDLVTSLSIHGQRAKIRTGGITREDFPASREIVRFVRTCMAANVPFKATAGLHHPIRCFKPLTYAPDAPKGTMHGFLNLLMMTSFARESFRVSLLADLMEEEFGEVFKFTSSGVSWRDEFFLTNGHLMFLRSRGMHSFGSCSFTEPIEDLKELGLL